MKKNWIKALIISSVVALSLLIAGLLAGVIFGGEIKELAVKELNKRLNTEVKVNGNITFSLFSNFPFASIAFNKVEMRETLPEKNNLLSCEKITLLFNIWDLFGSNYSMKRLVAEHGQLDVRINAAGEDNFDIFKNSVAGSEDREVSFRIEEATLSDILIHYNDERSTQHYVFDTKSSTLSGNFSSDNFLLNIKSDLLCRQLVVNGIDYLPGRQTEINGVLQVDLLKNLYTLQNAALTVEGNQFIVTGNIQSLQEGNQLDLEISCDELRIEEIAALLPSSYSGYLSHFKSKGNFQFKGNIHGMASANSSPQVNIQFAVRNGMLSHDQLNETFKQVNIEGLFTNGTSASLQSSSIVLKNFSVSFDGNPISGMLAIRNFRNPYIDMKLDGKIALHKIMPLFPSKYITQLDGTVTFQHFYFRGSVDHLNTTAGINKIQAGGSFNLKEVTITTDKTEYDHLNGTFDISNNQIGINSLSFKAHESDLHFEGVINNFLPYLLTSFNDSVQNFQKVGLTIKLMSNNLLWTDLVGKSDASSSHDRTSSDYPIPSIFYIVTGSVTGRIESFQYEKFNASAIHGSILFMENNIYFNDFGLNAEGGTIAMNGKLDITNVKRNRLDLTAMLDHLDINRLFHEFDNFGQTALTENNLKGLITSQMALQATWDQGKFNNSKLYAVADVSVENGELNNFEPMMALAKFVKISELRNIRFSRLQNQVEIKNQKVYIPTMQIFSNALNVELTGTHSFNNIIDYKIQLNLLKLLTSKFQKTSPNPELCEKTTEGFLNLYLTMTGPAGNPEIKYDKQAVKQKIAADLKNEKNELKGALKKEFDQQEQNKEDIKDYKPGEGIQYMEFEEDSIIADNGNVKPDESATRQNQKKEFDNFKNIFKPKTPPRNLH